MRIRTMLTGISILAASAWLVPIISEVTGYSTVFGFVTLGSLAAFAGGMVFYKGYTDGGYGR